MKDNLGKPSKLEPMKIIPYLIKQKNMVIKFVHLQLFITLISTPILLSWGMPLSLLTFAGNLFFSPILTAFLLFSSLAFFCEILHIPNGTFIFCLEHITHWWLWLMGWGSKQSLLALALPSLFIILLIPTAALIILHHKKINTPYKSIACYSLVLLMVCVYIKCTGVPTVTVDTLPCNKGAITFIKDTKQLALIDPGVIGRRLSAPSWCEYTLMPHLAKQYGTTTIDHLIVLQPNRIIFDALAALLEKITIKNIYLPLWQGSMPRFWLKSYCLLRDSCKQKNCTLIRLGTNSCAIPLSTGSSINIEPLSEIIELETFSYPCFCLTSSIDNQNVQIYSAKRKVKKP